jgi:hypothetical protein
MTYTRIILWVHGPNKRYWFRPDMTTEAQRYAVPPPVVHVLSQPCAGSYASMISFFTRPRALSSQNLSITASSRM